MIILSEIARRVVRTLTPYSFYLKLARFYGAKLSCYKLGRAEYRRLMSLAEASQLGPLEEFNIPWIPHPILVRPGTSDVDVFEGNLLRESYACLNPNFPVSFIIDAGANVGYSSIYFLNRYTESHIVALEPDYDNYVLAEKNLAPYRNRVQLLNAAIWPVKAHLRVQRRGRANGTQVVAVSQSEKYDCLGVDPMTVLEESGYQRISIFKCDIEGAETYLFSENCDAWIKKTNSIVMEIHTQQARKVVYDTMKRYPFDSFQYREQHVFVRRLL